MAWRGAAHVEAASWKLVLAYDPNLAESLAEFDIAYPAPALWNEFEALAPVPVPVIRGAKSDILSATTLEAMRARHPRLESIEVPDQRHVPLLDDVESIARIAAFVATCEETIQPQKA